VTLYPLHCTVAAKLHDRQGLAATLLVILGILLLVTPTAVLMNSLGDTIRELIEGVQQNSLQIPSPRDSVASWPLVGEKLYATWSQAHDDLPGLVQSLQPKIGELAKAGLGFVASIGVGLLTFLGALILAGIFMAFGEAGQRACQAVFERVAGKKRGAEFSRLSVATIRAVAQGVVGVAFIQAIVVGLSLLIARVPWPGALAAIVLVLGIAQVPALLVTLPAIVYVWTRGDYGNVELGRGVDVPMPVILVGALDGMAAAGILGMFVGATLLALVYQMFKGWVEDNPEDETSEHGAI
jgi:predicted PurR-regulated permease PerM